MLGRSPAAFNRAPHEFAFGAQHIVNASLAKVPRMKPLLVRLAVLLLALAGAAPPALAQAAIYPPDYYPNLVQCYVFYEQDRIQADARGDRARSARRVSQNAGVMQLLAASGQALGKTAADVEADLRVGINAYFTGLAAGTIDPEDLPKSVAACEAWLQPAP